MNGYKKRILDQVLKRRFKTAGEVSLGALFDGVDWSKSS